MGDPSREVVVTGAGVCCNLGDELEQIERMLRRGETIPFERWEPAVRYDARNQVIGMYHGDLSDEALGLGKRQARFMGRASRLALRAARTALAQSGIDRAALAVAVSSGTGDVETHIEVHRRLEQTQNAKRVSPTVVPRMMSSTVSANLVNALQTKGPSFSTAAACAGGAYNIIHAAMLIEHGHCDGALAGGVEATDIHFHSGFDAMRAYNSSDNDRPEIASRPYAANRAGFIFGEGCGVVVLETRRAAEERGATVLGVVRGYGMSSDGEGDMVAPSTDGAYRAMRRAVEHAGLSPEDIDYVNTHGTSTPVGDLSEVRAMRRLFDERLVAYSSTKGYTGHTISGAGALEAIFTLAMLRGGWIAPSVHAEGLDPELEGYPPVRAPERRTLRYGLSNSFGFGGTNATLVLSPP
jgi:3-oxoacyl-[acyl-carrier-protein] synthase-1